MLGIKIPHLIIDPKMFIDTLVSTKGLEEEELSF